LRLLLFEPPLFEPLLLFEEEEEEDELLFDPLLRDDEPPDELPPLFDALLREEPPPDELPLLLEPLLFDAVLRDDDEPPLLLDELLREELPPDDEPPLLLDPLLREELPPLFDAELRVDEAPLLLDPLLREDDPAARDDDREEPDDEPELLFRREVLRCSFRPRPALNATVVRSGMVISVPVRGLRPVRAARVRFVNFPKPGIDSAPAACTASAMAPDAVSKIASTTRAAAALVSSAFSATASMNSPLVMFGSPSGAVVGRGPAAPRTPEAHTVALLLGRIWNRLASPRPLPAVEARAEAVHHLARRVGGLPEGLLSAFPVRL
jgi:hypothetical protein